MVAKKVSDTFLEPVRTPRYRLIRCADGSGEFYDHQSDPQKYRNRIDDEAYSDEVARLSVDSNEDRKTHIHEEMRMRLRLILVPLLLATFTNVCAAQRPNILWIVADDLGHGDVGFTGCRDIHTPAIDTIAKSGVICRSAYSPHPFCGPSRAALMSGRYQQRFSFYGNPLPKSASGYDPDVGLPRPRLALLSFCLNPVIELRSLGNGTWGAKTNSIRSTTASPTSSDSSMVTENYYRTDLHWQSVVRDESTPWNTRPPADESRKDYLTDLLSDEAVRIIKETDHEKPLFLYLAYNAPHTPMQATSDWLDRVDGIEDPLRRVYAAMVTAMDDGIGRVTEALREVGRLDNTLIVITSDNGGIPPVNGANNQPFRGMKGNLLEGGIRVPMAIAWPARLPAATEFEHPVIGFDAYSTSAAAAGIAMDELAATDSVDLLPYLSGDRKDPPHDALYWRTGGRGQAAVRSGTRKLFSVQTLSDRVFDLQQDQRELRPITDDAELKRLSTRLSEWEAMLPPTQYDGPPATKWPEQSRAIGLTPSRASLRNAKLRDQKNSRVLRAALPLEANLTANVGNADTSIDPRFLRWGDQGDNTYANPLLNGDFADSDVERDEANDRWVMITSTNHLSPGMTILESRDLVNWRYTAHAFPTIAWEPQYNWDKMNGYRWGCWAGDLVRHNGEWLCYQIDFQSGLYLNAGEGHRGSMVQARLLAEAKALD